MNRNNVFRCAFLAILLLTSACAKRPAETPAFRPVPADPIQSLRTQVERVLSDPAFDNAFWGVSIQSLANGQMIYEQNSGKLLMPASNMKLITAAACLKKLGAEFQYETKVQSDGSIDHGTLTGNLIIRGSGDPTISARFGNGNHFQVFDDWAKQLQQMGIRKIAGDVIGVDEAFDDERIGYGWSWDDLPYYYATETAALQFAENAITVMLRAGQPGEPVLVSKEPDTSYITVVDNIQIEPGAEMRMDWRYDPQTRTVHATGVLPPDGQDYGAFSVHNPAAYFATALKETLERHGIEIQGEAYGGTDRFYESRAGDERLILTHRSPPLREMLGVLLKVSQNLYAETLLKTIGGGNFSTGIKEVELFLQALGIAPGNFIITDGSGLSRYNYVTPNGLLQLLIQMHRDPEFETFFHALAIAGVDGTLRSRMKDTSASNNVRAKTGSLSNVRSLSGYARTRDGEWIAFVMIANNFSAPTESVQSAQDLILQQLTSFSRSR
jgi:D-alanyl-D-alanine carboxypeptidase/D-alanyl-D-alanine-endopeptidase (penicillin-binding protein 4)